MAFVQFGLGNPWRGRAHLGPLLALLLLGCGDGDNPPVDANVAWVVTLDGDGSQKVESLATDADGNVIAAGSFRGTLDVDGTSFESAGDDVFVGKWTRRGEREWLQTFGGLDLDQAHGVAVDASGNVYVTGSFSEQIDFGTGPLVATARQTIFLAKLGPDGSALWADAWGTEQFQSASSVELAPDGDVVVVAGEFVSSLAFEDEPLVSSGSSDVFVATFDADGVPLASKAFGDAAAQRVTGLTLDAHGNIVLLGGFRGSLDFGDGPLVGGTGTFEALYVAKLDPRLNAIWSRNALPLEQPAEHAHGLSTSAHGLAIDSDSSVLVQAAYSVGQAGTGQDFEAPAAPRGFLVQYTRSGEPTLSRALGSSGSQGQGAIALDGADHRWLAVSFAEAIDVDGAGELASSGGLDIALLELDPQNRLLRGLRYGEPKRSETAWDIATFEQAITVGGWSRETNVFGEERGLIVQFEPRPSSR